jgi:hypothetical protein
MVLDRTCPPGPAPVYGQIRPCANGCLKGADVSCAAIESHVKTPFRRVPSQSGASLWWPALRKLVAAAFDLPVQGEQ